jgi:hypothetical protein
MALEPDLVTIGWDELGDLAEIHSREDLEGLYRHIVRRHTYSDTASF